MQSETIKKLFTVREYHRMGEVGILGPEDRTELIDGEVIRMSPTGHRHAMCVTRAIHAFAVALSGKALVNTQNPLVLNDYSEPQPDLVLLKYRSDFYKSKQYVGPEDALLVLEVSDTTLRFDLTIKLPRYAVAGVPELWIENLIADELLVFREPTGEAYTTNLTLKRGESVSLAAFPEVLFKVEDLLG
jgi:Uma2 family endonuclease